MTPPSSQTPPVIQRPDQLEEVLRFTSARSWLSLAAMCIVVGLAVIWGIFGEIQSTVNGEAIFLTDGGLFQIIAKETGHLQENKVQPGDHVKKDQIVAFMSNPQLEKLIDLKRASLNEMKENHVRQTRMILARTEAQRRVLDSQRLELLQKKLFIQRRIRAMDERVRTYEKLLEEQAVPRQSYLNAKMEYEKAAEDAALTETSLSEILSKRRQLDANAYEQIFQLKFRVDTARDELETLKKKLELTSEIRSAMDGIIVESLAKRGQLVREGEAVMTCQGAGVAMEVEIFVPAQWGKKVHPGMPIHVTPSTVQREEYGFITGKVSYVSLFPISKEALTSWLKNDRLVDAIMRQGPVLSIEGDIDKDPSTRSGFRWSSAKGADVTVTVGTLGRAEIVVLKQPPIVLVLPTLKKWLGL